MPGQRSWCAAALAVLSLPASLPATEGSPPEVAPILEAISALESVRDPKCYATASRLEDFMYGTPLTEGARQRKITLQKALLRKLWRAAGEVASARGASEVDAADLVAARKGWFEIVALEDGGRSFRPQGGPALEITHRDFRQYSSIAYGLRAILGLQQELLLSGEEGFPALTQAGIDALKEVLDVATLATLQLADRRAREDDVRVLDGDALEEAWSDLLGDDQPAPEARAAAPAGPADLSLLRKIIEQKKASYEKYNKLSAAVFLRNLQVYFARYRWPTDSEASAELKKGFTEAMVLFATELYRGSQGVAASRGHALVRVEDVGTFLRSALPHEMNSFEDARFFPRLPKPQQVFIEAFDMDAFRDAGLHWRYLEAAIDEADFTPTHGLDPFAAELLTENVAQFGVLLLRVAGQHAEAQKHPSLRRHHVELAIRDINHRLALHARVAAGEAVAAPTPARGDADGRSSATSRGPLASADLPPPSARGQKAPRFFEDVTEASGVAFRHRSADWLNRLIRSYSLRDGNVAVLAVPPAFGGAGLAAEDLDGDDLPDLLLLSGSGNRLYRNLGQGRFEDVTEAAGLVHTRAADGLPGEPRQPLVADFDNDGRPDLVITYANDPHRIYRNLGGMRFEDVTAKAGLGGEGLVGGPATAADFDGDGLTDLYIGYFGDYPNGIKPTLARRNVNGQPNVLLRNLGGMRFEDATAGSGVANRGWTQAVAHTDFDRDGRQDLIVGNDFGINSYYRNLGGGRFVDMAPVYETDKPSYTMNVGLADLNDDLFPDVYISNIVTMDKDQGYVLPDASTPAALDARKMANMRVVEANDLFLSEGKDEQLRRYIHSDAVGRGLSSTGWAWGACFMDVDNDSDDDLYVTNGMNEFAVYSAENPYYTDPSGEARKVTLAHAGEASNVFFLNSGGSLKNASALSGLDKVSNSRAAAHVDLDRDGDLDVVLTGYHEEASVYLNQAQRLSNNWLTVRLVGDPKKATSTDAIGARMILTRPDGHRIWREVRCGEGYLTTQPKEQHFGLSTFKAGELVVEWPDGTRSTHSLEAGARYRIRQGDPTAERLGPGAAGEK